MLDRLKNKMAGWELAPLHASMFGSTARGTGDVQSDIDLLIIREEGLGEDSRIWRDQLDELAQDIRAWTGNNAGIVELSETDLDQLRHNPPPIFADLEADGIDLYGVPLRQILKGDKQ